MQLNKTQSFSKSINSHIVSMKLFFITHIFIDSSFASILYTFFFLFIFPSFSHTLPYFWAQLFILCFPVGTRGKESTCQYRRHKRHSFNPWVGKILWSRKWQHTPVFLPGKFYEQRILMGYRPCCCKDQAWLCSCTCVFHSITMKLPFPSLRLLKSHFFHNISWEIKFRQKEAEQECVRETCVSWFLSF